MKLNLLRQETGKYSKVALIKRINRLVVLVTGGIFVGLVLLIAGQFAYYSIRSQTLVKQMESLETAYSGRAEEVTKYMRAKRTLDEAGRVIGQRFNYQDLLTNAYSTFPGGVFVSGADFTDKTNLRFMGRARGVKEYGAFLEKFEKVSKEGGFLYSKVIQESLARGADGSYQFSLNLQAKK